MKKIDQAIEFIHYKLRSAENPADNMSGEYYIRQDAKATILKEVFYQLRQIREDK